ncbi:ribonuclease P protein subunit p30 [Condylostylus longicornis]|uniref:ribonuclease P protein subunit p30 n=1 Tax=Condylostylus longicornis TaxID=2530218 RepID=UPI00244E0077|nr:ribonuclease P protein subunit p30 [Condylostylus longicornis]
MDLTRAFYDFCIPLQNDKIKLISILKEALKLGYRTVAIEEIYDHSQKENKKSSDIFPSPVELDFLEEFNGRLRILRRLTIIYSDVNISHPMSNSLNLKKYDLIAGLPKNDNALNHCYTSFAGDLICFNPDASNLFIQRKPYQVAVARGMFIEIKYSDAIQNSTYRKDIIKIAHNYHVKGKSKNIIISSGAKSVFELRGPYDIANLALIFGLSEEQGKSSISSLCRMLFLKAEGRRLGKTNTIAKLKDIEENDSSENEDMEMDNIFEADFSEQPFKKKKIS